MPRNKQLTFTERTLKSINLDDFRVRDKPTISPRKSGELSNFFPPIDIRAKNKQGRVAEGWGSVVFII